MSAPCWAEPPAAPQMGPFDAACLVYQDADLLVLNKPAGLLSVPGRGPAKADCLSARVQQVWPQALVVHRLDQATSGLLLMALNPVVQRLLGDAFAARRIQKHYQALVAQVTSAPALSGTWQDIDLPLSPDWPRRPRSRVDFGGGKPSQTRWRVLGPGPGSSSRLALQPLTGRSHQLRVHLASIGQPILGDALYAGPPAERLMLHAQTLELLHPVTGQALHLQCPVPF